MGLFNKVETIQPTTTWGGVDMYSSGTVMKAIIEIIGKKYCFSIVEIAKECDVEILNAGGTKLINKEGLNTILNYARTTGMKKYINKANVSSNEHRLNRKILSVLPQIITINGAQYQRIESN